MAARVACFGFGGALAISGVEAYRRRPLRSWEVAELARGSKEPPADASAEADSFLFRRMRDVMCGFTVMCTGVVLDGMNTVQVHDYENFTAAYEARHVRPLLTVCNHDSCIDDPMLSTWLVPLKDKLSHTSHSWRLCGEDMCFKTPALAAAFGVLHTLPIKRQVEWKVDGSGGTDSDDGVQRHQRRQSGEEKGVEKEGGDSSFVSSAGQSGIMQLRLKQLTDKLGTGWVHLFPEGRIWQGTTVGGTDPYLRWGVGKMVAAAKVTPAILPYVHVGMASVLPHSKANNRLISAVPSYGQTVSIKVGRPVEVDDLLHEFWTLHRHEYCSEGAGGSNVCPATLSHALMRDWERQPTAAEAELYSAITARVHESLLGLERELREQTGVHVDPEWQDIYRAAQRAQLQQRAPRGGSSQA